MTVDPRTGVITEALSEEERNELAAHEQVIKRGLKAFKEVGVALFAVRDSRLYRADHGSFEAYCWDRWQMGRSRADRLIEAAAIIEALPPIGGTLPTNEAQARELTGLDPEVAADVVERAAEAGPLTAATIRQARQQIAPKASPAARDEGKRPATPRADNRKSITDAFRDKTTDLLKIVNGLTDLAADDRFSRNKEQVAARNGSDLRRAIDALTGVAEQLN